MSKFSIRIVSLLLVPALLADPALAHYEFRNSNFEILGSDGSAKSEIRNPRSEIFVEQALTTQLVGGQFHWKQAPSAAIALIVMASAALQQDQLAPLFAKLAALGHFIAAKSIAALSLSASGFPALFQPFFSKTMDQPPEWTLALVGLMLASAIVLGITGWFHARHDKILLAPAVRFLAHIKGSAEWGSCGFQTECVVAPKLFLATGLRPDLWRNNWHYHLRLGDDIIDPTLWQFFNVPEDFKATVFVGSVEDLLKILTQLHARYGFKESLRDFGAPLQMFEAIYKSASLYKSGKLLTASADFPGAQYASVQPGYENAASALGLGGLDEPAFNSMNAVRHWVPFMAKPLASGLIVLFAVLVGLAATTGNPGEESGEGGRRWVPAGLFKVSPYTIEAIVLAFLRTFATHKILPAGRRMRGSA